MNDPRHWRPPQGSSPEAPAVRQVVEQFDAAWSAIAPGGSPPEIASFLAPLSESGEVEETLYWLIRAEHRNRLEQRLELLEGQTYRDRFPQFGQVVEAALQDRLLGAVVDGYEIVSLIKAGGMGEVYRARHAMMADRCVALKLIKADRREGHNTVDRFRREIAVSSALRHENIVQVYHAGKVGGLLYLVMELIDGPDLEDVVKREGPLAVPRALNYIRQAARGLKYAHDKGFVHRDIKPNNLLLDDRGTVKILDQGLARPLDRAAFVSHVSTSDRQVFGTPAYMAPEQIESFSTADARADIYSLGCTLFFLLTGRPPFVADILQAHLSKRPPSLKDCGCPASPALERMLAQMLERRTIERTKSAEQLLRELDQLGALDLPTTEVLPRRPEMTVSAQNDGPTRPIPAYIGGVYAGPDWMPRLAELACGLTALGGFLAGPVLAIAPHIAELSLPDGRPADPGVALLAGAFAWIVSAVAMLAWWWLRRHSPWNRTNDLELKAYLRELDRLDHRFAANSNSGARARLQDRTVGVLQGLSEGGGKAHVIRRLYQLGLIVGDAPVLLLENADLRNASLSGMKLDRVNFSRADLRGANLRKTSLVGAHLEQADLRQANLSDAQLHHAVLKEARIDLANFSGSNVSLDQIDQAQSADGIVLSDGTLRAIVVS